MDIKGIKDKYLPLLLKTSESPELDLDIIITLSIGKDRVFVCSHPEYEFNKKELSKTKKNISRRLKGFPIAYIRGYQEFMGNVFYLNKHTLVPRPETEIMVENIVTDCQADTLVLDIGTGSGAIIVSLAKLLRKDNISLAATDISLCALRQAKKNAKLNGLDIDFYWKNLLNSFPWKKYSEFRRLIIAANLPYISQGIYSKSKTIKKEPKRAIISREEGLRHYRLLIEQAKNIPDIFNEIIVYCEISPEQSDTFHKVTGLDKQKLKIIPDLSGRDRLIKIVFRK